MTASLPSSHRNLFIRFSLILTLGLFPLLSGCAVAVVGAAAGAGAVAYVRGELETSLDQNYAKVVEATRAAMKDLEFVRVSENKDALEAVLIYRTGLDKKVEVKLSKVTDNTTKVKIRVGLIGDEVRSISVLEKIRANL